MLFGHSLFNSFSVKSQIIFQFHFKSLPDPSSFSFHLRSLPVSFHIPIINFSDYYIPISSMPYSSILNPSQFNSSSKLSSQLHSRFIIGSQFPSTFRCSFNPYPKHVFGMLATRSRCEKKRQQGWTLFVWLSRYKPRHKPDDWYNVLRSSPSDLYHPHKPLFILDHSRCHSSILVQWQDLDFLISQIHCRTYRDPSQYIRPFDPKNF